MQVIKLLRCLDRVIDTRRGRSSPVVGVTSNSKAVKPGFVFVAIAGVVADGHDYITQAVAHGALVVVYQDRSRVSAAMMTDKRVWFVHVGSTRDAITRLACCFYGYPSKKIAVTGITGTNGKTTITYLIESLVSAAGKRPGVIGTVNYRYNGRKIPSCNTTPGPVELQSLLSDMRKAKTTHLAMEVSSHALDQGRIDGIDFTAAIFTNLTRDHLDYHKTFERYFRAKAKLFVGLKTDAVAIINRDDAYGGKLMHATRAKILTYGLSSRADVFATEINASACGTTFILHLPGGKSFQIKVCLIGRHNVYNILAAAAWAYSAGFKPEVIRRGIERFRCVPGRLEKVSGSGAHAVFVDYAHTDDALRNVISTLRQIVQERLIVVFGCGGDRDRSKRPLMGRVATDLADFAIITDDNPRSEDPRSIARDIVAGIVKQNYCIVHDRARAIQRSVRMSKRGDIVLIAGKGHETYQLVNKSVLKFDDRKVARACLRSTT
jgi:UDP-N-acetylmuramoyl-L-alanyl-D-glutamate--2,6-diaminopimelate ligase